MAKTEPSLQQKLRGIGISQPYACQIANGDRKPSLKTALKIYHALRLTLGPLAGATPSEIRALQRLAARNST
jgi:transcriptional regulator with XRE-family HTH domain